MSVFDYYFYYYSSVYAGYPFVIKVAIIIITILLVLTIMSVLRFFYVRHKQRLEKKRKKVIDEKYREKLVDLFYFSFREVSVAELKHENDFLMPRKKWQNRMLTDLILKIKADNSFEMTGGIFQNKNYHNFLTYTKLFDFWVNEIASTNSNKAIKALRMVNEIGEGIKGSAFSRSLYHQNKYLRKFARMTFTRFDANDPYKFLEQGFDKHFNKFDEKRLHYILIEMNKEHPIPLLSKWVINSNKESYQCFLIREMGFFKQIEGTAYLIQLLNSEPTLPIRRQIMETLGDLEYTPLIELIALEFKFAANPLQSSMIEGLKRLKSKKSIPFLSEAFQITQYDEIKIKIVELLQEFDDDGCVALKLLSKKSNSEFEDNLFAYALR